MSYVQKSRFEEFLHKNLHEEYDVYKDTHYNVKNYLTKPRDINDPYPWKYQHIKPHNFQPHERAQDMRPYIKNPTAKTTNFYDKSTGIYNSDLQFGRGIYKLKTFL